jgi:hypothetical protein
MKVTGLETFTVGAGWKNWLFVRVRTDAGLTRLGGGTLTPTIRMPISTCIVKDGSGGSAPGERPCHPDSLGPIETRSRSTAGCPVRRRQSSIRAFFHSRSLMVQNRVLARIAADKVPSSR